MGLQEKRMLKTLQEDVLPEREKEIQKITGVKIKYEVNWDSMASSLGVMERFRDCAFKSLNESFTSVCRDDIGKGAVKESIQTIHFSQGGDSNMTGVTLKDGLLDIPWDWEGWGGSFFAESLTERLESLL